MNGRALPVPGVDRDQSVEAILARAIELADRTAPGGRAELTLSDLHQVAATVGVPPAAVSAAVAEQQLLAGLPTSGPVSRLVGPVAVVGWRRVEADPDRTERLVAEWLESRHALRVRRLGDGTLVASRKPGIAGSVARTLRSARGGRDLAGRGEVRASVVAEQDDGLGAVACVLVDLRRRRAESVAGGSAVGVLGLGASVAAGAVLAAPLAAVGVPLSLAAGVVTAALHHRSVVRDVTEEVEVTLDAVAGGEPPGGALAELVRSVSRRTVLPRTARG